MMIGISGRRGRKGGEGKGKGLVYHGRGGRWEGK